MFEEFQNLAFIAALDIIRLRVFLKDDLLV